MTNLESPIITKQRELTIEELLMPIKEFLKGLVDAFVNGTGEALGFLSGIASNHLVEYRSTVVLPKGDTKMREIGVAYRTGNIGNTFLIPVDCLRTAGSLILPASS